MLGDDHITVMLMVILLVYSQSLAETLEMVMVQRPQLAYRKHTVNK